MDEQGRGQSGDIDPADQWVFNPDTARYELRLNPPSPASDSTPTGGRASRRRATPPRQRGTSAGGRRGIPPQRTRRGHQGEDTEPDEDGNEAPGHGRSSGGGRRAARNAPTGHGRRKPKPKLSRKQKALRWTGGVMGFLMVAGCTSAYFLYQHFNNNLESVDVGIDNDATSDGPVNLLLIGSDTRSGKGNSGYGDPESVGHADTTLLFHVSKDRTNATVLSIPRDLITDIPDCPTKKDGETKVIPGVQDTRFNTSLGQEGRDPGCTWRTVEKLTGLKINHFMMADFDSVKTLSTAVGGVEVCVAKDIDDPKSHLKLKAGRHTIKGEDALAFVRTRKSVGFSSDLDRIKLQQQFLGSMIRKMKSGGTLTDPGKLWDLSEAATKALTVDDGIGSVRKLISLANDLKRVNIKNVSFVTLPVIDNPEEVVKSTVVLDEAKANPLFRMIAADNSLTAEKKPKRPVAKAPASEVRVDVFNGGAETGSAQDAVTWLQNDKGVGLSTNSGNAPKDLAKTTLTYAPNQADQAATLADMMGLPKSAMKKQSTDAGPREPMTLTLGADFTAVGEPIAAPTEAPKDLSQMNGADKGVCAK